MDVALVAEEVIAVVEDVVAAVEEVPGWDEPDEPCWDPEPVQAPK